MITLAEALTRQREVEAQLAADRQRSEGEAPSAASELKGALLPDPDARA